MGIFDRFRRRKDMPTGPGPSARTVADLTEFIRTREGVEGYVEPRTSIYALTLCLVAGDGEHMRRAVKDEQQARSLCADHGVPVYDARIVGYPRRMRDYEAGNPQPRISLADLPPLEVAGEDHEPPARDD